MEPLATRSLFPCPRYCARPPPAAGVCVWLHGGDHVGKAVDIFLAGLPVAFVVFACPVGWQGGWQRGGTVHCGDVRVRVGTTLLAIDMMTALLDHAAKQDLVLLMISSQVYSARILSGKAFCGFDRPKMDGCTFLFFVMNGSPWL